ncbi:hypothetical protein Tco_0841774 [Tanacetum coccineum]|uniref:Uncharacterized protein n=1 Tax=Tanacetum coccineum TaxID=301880 RepID=A0ABQ5B040_9ASTR
MDIGSRRSGKWKGKELMVEENTFDYAMVYDMTSHDAIERLRRLKEPYNIMCRSLHDIDTYTTRLSRGNSDGLSDYIRAVKHCLPGPCVCNPCPIKAEPRLDHHAGQVKNKVAIIAEAVLLRTVGSSCWSSKKQSGKNSGRSSANDSGSSCWPSKKKGKPRNKAGDSGYTGSRAPRNERCLIFYG